MVLTPQGQRSLKLFTAVATVGVGIQAMFFSDYHIDGFEGQDHIFTNIQKDMRTWVDTNIYGIDDTTAATKQPLMKVDKLSKDATISAVDAGRPHG